MKLLTVLQLSAKLGGRGRSSIYRDVEAGLLPQPVKYGHRVYWVESEVDERLAQAPRVAIGETVAAE